MYRFALAVAVAFCLAPTLASAQNPHFTVTARSASIYQAPSAGSPVIGQSMEGAVLDIRSELPEWIEVSWPTTAKGVAYLRAATGRIDQTTSNRAAAGTQRPVTPMTIDEFVHGTPAAPAAEPAPAPAAAQRPMTIDEYVHGTGISAATPAATSSNPAAYVAQAVQAVSAASTPRPRAGTSSATYVAPSHFIGIGGRIVDFSPNVGPSARIWSRMGLGVQFEVVRASKTNAVTDQRLTSMQFAPGVLYALPNAVSDYFWIRPYVGGGVTIAHSTLRSVSAPEAGSLSDSSLGVQAFGGGELTFAGIPRFALSADVRYRRMQAGFAALERRNVRLALSGHWFVH